jgi:hypothetical protein
MAEVSQFKTLEDQVKEAQLKKDIRAAQTWTWDKERAMTEAKAKTEGFTDIFKQQESFNQSIMKVIEGMSGGDTTPTYVTAQAPQQQEQPKSQNYLLYIGIGIFVVYLFFFRKKR